MLWRLLFLMLMATPAAATQEYILPTLFDISDVAADDVLNIRESPSADAAIIGSLPPDATGIEIVATHGNWGAMNVGERSGWVSMRYLTYRTDVWNADALPENFSCSGTEPFWSFEPRAEGLVWWTPEGETVYDRLTVLDTGVFRSPRRGLVAQGDAGRLMASVTNAACNDGMSERQFGLEATVILEDVSTQLYSGCCQIAPAR
ncbi:COG3650 family protein [Paracoccus aerodenitrificans]|uniref:COG3650 family protein n=1 Tax=Paracoccus aerodenitrificans TaxID=3017781 RepID=UPI0022F0D2B3|nr:SH3 domain-containing protein [Paracoccus aerodenitrificans]WBU64100.1 peptide-binding protein [Paracoccus aerodenitrificans]